MTDNRKYIKTRVKAVRRQLRQKNLDCLIVTSPQNVRYLTGFTGSDSWAVVAGAGLYLLTDSRYIEQAKMDCPGCQKIERREPMAQTVAELLGRLKSVKTAAIEKNISLAGFDELKEQVKAPIKPQLNIVENIRDSKDPDEIKRIEAAANIARHAFRAATARLKPKITEAELAANIDFEIHKKTADTSFRTIVAFGPNASEPHHLRGKKKLKKNDNVLIDFGAKYEGYCCDITRSFSVGKPTGLYLKVWKTVKTAQEAAIAEVRANAKIKAVDAAAREIIKAAALGDYGHPTGHGLGLEVHESPTVSSKNPDTLKAGQTITIEPAIYLPGKFGIRLEDDLLVTHSGCRVLTQACPHYNQLQLVSGV